MPDSLPAPVGRRLARRKVGESLSARLVECLGELPTVAATVAEVALELGESPADVRRVIVALEHDNRVESWPCPDRPGSILVMLSAQTAARRGLRLDRRGVRWLEPGSDRIPISVAALATLLGSTIEAIAGPLAAGVETGLIGYRPVDGGPPEVLFDRAALDRLDLVRDAAGDWTFEGRSWPG